MRPEDAWLLPYIERAHFYLRPHCASDLELTDWLVWIARRAFAAGRETALLEVRTSTEVAAELGVHRTTVFRWARRMGLGWDVGRDLLFVQADVDRLREMKR